MGWLDVKEGKGGQHLQMIATGNISEIDRIQQRERRRKWFIFLDVVAILSLIVSYLLYKAKFYSEAYWSFGVAIVIFIYLIFKKIKSNHYFKKRKDRNFRRNRR
ncbi:MAG: hypothetical protein AABY00_00360 [Nanoarchaeota archaeon]